MSMAKKILMAVLTGCLIAPGAMALGADITIWDGQHDGTSDPWWDDPGVVHRENNETEPGTVTDDTWDLEGFFFDFDIPTRQATLELVGTYDFAGQGPNVDDQRGPYDPGDLFIIDEFIPDGSFFSSALGGINWFLDIDWVTAGSGFVNYRIFEVTGATTFTVPTVVPESTPWRASGGEFLGNGQAILSTIAGDGTRLSLENGDAGIHNVVSFDWDRIANRIGLTEGDAFTTHWTMSCGNDVVYGSTTQPFVPPIPEPASMALLGMGILGIAMRRRFTA